MYCSKCHEVVEERIFSTFSYRYCPSCKLEVKEPTVPRLSRISVVGDYPTPTIAIVGDKGAYVECLWCSVIGPHQCLGFGGRTLG